MAKKACSCENRSAVKVIFVGMTDDIYTVDADGSVELDNDMSEDQDTIRVQCGDCDRAYDFHVFDLDDAVEEAKGDQYPGWVLDALTAVFEERGF